jgi:hypothetical protein
MSQETTPYLLSEKRKSAALSRLPPATVAGWLGGTQIIL